MTPLFERNFLTMKRIALLLISACVVLAGCGAANSAASSSEAASTASSTAASSEAASAASGDDYYQYEELDYTSTYRDGNDEDADTVELTKTEGTSYEATISIYRLCELTGTGSIMDGAVELELTDPNGNAMTAIFYPEDEYSYAFKVTTSTWDYLPEGTEFTGFQSVENL